MRSAFRVVLVLLSLVFGPWASVCASAAEAAKGVVRVGLLDPIDGTYAREGREVDSGFRYYLATHDDALGGFHVELRTADEGDSAGSALASAHELVEQDAVDAIVGLVTSKDALGVADYLDALKKPIVITSAGADDLTQVARTSFLRVSDASSQDTMPLGDYACRRLGKRNAAIVAVDSPFGTESAGGFARTYTEAGCRIVQETYVGDDPDWNAVAAKIDRHADLVFVSFSSASAPRFLEAYRASGPKTTIVGTGLITDELVLGEERDTALGAITALHYAATLSNPENEAFRVGYEALGGHPVSHLVENGYVAAAAISAALEKLPAGPIKGDALAASLRAVTLHAPRGELHFDPTGQVVDSVYIRRVRQVGGRYRNDVIATYPNVTQFWHYDPERYRALPSYAKLKGTWVHQ